jgi:hypothetical protein
MTYPSEAVHECLALAKTGRTAPEISRVTGIPRATVKDWLAGRVPRRAMPRPFSAGCPACGSNEPHRYHELSDDYVHLLGLYLGDGCLSEHPRGVYKLRLALDVAYPQIVAYAMESMRSVMPQSRVNVRRTLSNNYEVYAYSKAWPCLFPQHGPGKKHLRPIALVQWQRELVARAPRLLVRGLIESDGCRFQNTGRRWSHPRYVFCNYSADIRRIFSDACDDLGLHWTSSRNVVYVSRVRDVAILDEFIGPKR